MIDVWVVQAGKQSPQNNPIIFPATVRSYCNSDATVTYFAELDPTDSWNAKSDETFTWVE